MGWNRIGVRGRVCDKCKSIFACLTTKASVSMDEKYLSRQGGVRDRVGLGLGLAWNRMGGVNYDTGSDQVSFRPGFVRQMK